MIGSPTETESAAKSGTNGRASTQPDELADLLERSFHRLSGALGELQILGSVQSDRAHLRLRRWIARAQGVVLLWIAAMVFVAAGAVLVVVGLAGGLRELFADRPWLGNLGAGLVLIGSVAAAWVGLRMAKELSEAKRLEKKYADMESKRDARP
jgi:hypothetical protein